MAEVVESSCQGESDTMTVGSVCSGIEPPQNATGITLK